LISTSKAANLTSTKVLAVSSTKVFEEKATVGYAPGSTLVAALRWVDRWVCMAGANCCVSRSVKATHESQWTTADPPNK
jgi:hypothetical protein